MVMILRWGGIRSQGTLSLHTHPSVFPPLLPPLRFPPQALFVGPGGKVDSSGGAQEGGGGLERHPQGGGQEERHPQGLPVGAEEYDADVAEEEDEVESEEEEEEQEGG